MKLKEFKPALMVALGMAIFILVVRQANQFDLTKGIAKYISI